MAASSGSLRWAAGRLPSLRDCRVVAGGSRYWAPCASRRRGRSDWCAGPARYRRARPSGCCPMTELCERSSRTSSRGRPAARMWRDVAARVSSSPRCGSTEKAIAFARSTGTRPRDAVSCGSTTIIPRSRVTWWCSSTRSPIDRVAARRRSNAACESRGRSPWPTLPRTTVSASWASVDSRAG